MLLLCLSKRAKSIYYLRLFNESVLMLPLYLAILLFTYQQWFWGVLLLSLSLSIKMNILLFFPGLLLLLFEVSLFSSSHPSPSASFAPSSSSASSSSRSSYSACPSSPPTPPTTSAAPTNSSLRCQGITRRAACSPTSGPSTSSSCPSTLPSHHLSTVDLRHAHLRPRASGPPAGAPSLLHLLPLVPVSLPSSSHR